MSLRFRRSIKLAPGVRMNFSGSGISWTLGPRGSSVGIGKRGTFLNSNLFGSGFQSRERISNSNSSSRSNTSAQNRIRVEITIVINDSGDISFRDANGNPLTEQVVNLAKKQKGEVIKKLIQDKCDEINGEIEALGRLHWHTPDANRLPHHEIAEFDWQKPLEPSLKPIGFLGRFFSGIRSKIEKENEVVLLEYTKSLQDWEKQKHGFDQWERDRYKLVNEEIYRSIEAMASYLEIQLSQIVWPRETVIAFDVSNDGKSIMLDVDLPECEHMPTKFASVPQRGYRLSIKDMGERKVQQLYVEHIHAIGFRLLGETFAALPTVQRVVLSAYSQRPNAATGQMRDDYLYSVAASRNEWLKINFDGLHAINVVDAIGRFECRREISKNGLAKPIEPFES